MVFKVVIFTINGVCSSRSSACRSDHKGTQTDVSKNLGPLKIHLLPALVSIGHLLLTLQNLGC